MKYRPLDTCRSLAKGTKPLAEAATIQHVLVMMVVHVARKILYGSDISIRVGIYVLGTLIVAVIGDFTAENSTSYFAQGDNFLNRIFVRVGWGWTLFLVSTFVGLTSYTTSCGKKDVIRNQALRMLIGTLVWFCYTTLFVIVEYKSGICSVTKYLDKASCASKGYRWRGFDISGHTFLLIWNNLFILEEGKAYLGWERIKDMLRNEEHKRLSVDLSPGGDAPDSTSLSRLKNEEFLHLRSNYKTYTPWVRLLFCLLAFMVTLWDWMLFCTVLYFHITLEKMIASALAILTWYLLYRVVYNQSWSPGLPGDGMFKYVKDTRFMRRESLKRTSELSSKTWTNRDDVPKFMGMPIYTPKPQKEELLEDDFTRNVRNARKASMDASVSTYNLRSRSRSASRTRMNSVSRSSLNSKLW